MPAEKRKEVRRRCYLGGRIEFNQRRMALPCIVRNRSAHGMLVLAPGARALPLTFDLVLPDKAETHRAEIAWRAADLMGLITRPADAIGGDPPSRPTDMA